MDHDRAEREQTASELPTAEMEEAFELWEAEYALETLTNLSTGQVRARKRLFESEVERLVVKHTPGRLVAGRPALSHVQGRPTLDAEEWDQARERIQDEAQDVRFRFEQALGVTESEDPGATRAWLTKLAEALPRPNIGVKR